MTLYFYTPLTLTHHTPTLQLYLRVHLLQKRLNKQLHLLHQHPTGSLMPLCWLVHIPQKDRTKDQSRHTSLPNQTVQFEPPTLRIVDCLLYHVSTLTLNSIVIFMFIYYSHIWAHNLKNNPHYRGFGRGPSSSTGTSV